MAFCLPGRFLTCLVAVGSTAGILKSTCNCFLCGSVSSAKLEWMVLLFQQLVLWKLTESCLRSSVKSAYSLSRFHNRGRCIACSGCGAFAILGRGLSGNAI